MLPSNVLAIIKEVYGEVKVVDGVNYIVDDNSEVTIVEIKDEGVRLKRPLVDYNDIPEDLTHKGWKNFLRKSKEVSTRLHTKVYEKEQKHFLVIDLTSISKETLQEMMTLISVTWNEILSVPN